MVHTALSTTAVALSTFFIVGGLYFLFTTDFHEQRTGRLPVAAALLLLPLYGLVEFGLAAGEQVSLLLLTIAGAAMVYGYRDQYHEVAA